MLAALQNFIPVISSEAGLCLTAENWKTAKVTMVSYSLECLLCKPGLNLLKKIYDLPHYLGWSGTLVLNAMSLVANKEGDYTLESPYDGSKIKLTSFELIELIAYLKPDAVVLPKSIMHHCPQIWGLWNELVMPFIYVDDLLYQDIPRIHGVYFNHLSESAFNLWSHLPRYVSGTFDANAIQQLRDQGIEFIETDEPANAALLGRVYTQAGDIDLMDKTIEMQFEAIDEACVCPTCSQKFTKAYLKHLLQHTPLLCQRLLIQHNVFSLAIS